MVINQPFGIGDIIFLEPMFRHFWNLNKEKPIVPVRDHLIWLQDYIESADFIKLTEFSEIYWQGYMKDEDGMDSTEITNNFFPARFANQIYRKLDKWDHSDAENMMLDKYRLAGLDPEMWRTIKLKFPFDKVQMHPPGHPYLLINNHCGVGDIGIDSIMGISPLSAYKHIIMNESCGTVIDWWQMMLHAKENHHVSTCTFFIMQAIFNEFNHVGPAFIYKRPNEDGLRGVMNLKPDYKCKLML